MSKTIYFVTRMGSFVIIRYTIIYICTHVAFLKAEIAKHVRYVHLISSLQNNLQNIFSFVAAFAIFAKRKQNIYGIILVHNKQERRHGRKQGGLSAAAAHKIEAHTHQDKRESKVVHVEDYRNKLRE